VVVNHLTVESFRIAAFKVDRFIDNLALRIRNRPLYIYQVIERDTVAFSAIRILKELPTMVWSRKNFYCDIIIVQVKTAGKG